MCDLLLGSWHYEKSRIFTVKSAYRQDRYGLWTMKARLQVQHTHRYKASLRRVGSSGYKFNTQSSPEPVGLRQLAES